MTMSQGLHIASATYSEKVIKDNISLNRKNAIDPSVEC